MGHSGQSNLRVLVVDDDPVDRQLIEKAFQNASKQVELVLASSGRAALNVLATNFENAGEELPDACLFDINMPGLSGIDLLKKMKEDDRFRRIPIVMLSSSDSQDEISDCYEHQASAYMCKPDNYGELKDMVARLHAYWDRAVRFP